MTTIEDIDLSGSEVQAAGLYETDAIALTEEAFIGIQVLKTATLPSKDFKIIPLVSNDGTNYAAIPDSKGSFVSFDVEVSADLQKDVSNLSKFFSLEPIRATNLKLRIPLSGVSQGVISLYVKTSMTES